MKQTVLKVRRTTNEFYDSVGIKQESAAGSCTHLCAASFLLSREMNDHREEIKTLTSTIRIILRQFSFRDKSKESCDSSVTQFRGDCCRLFQLKGIIIAFMKPWKIKSDATDLEYVAIFFENIQHGTARV